jgi:uncharacterized protein (DUF4213/DUF364 family)
MTSAPHLEETVRLIKERLTGERKAPAVEAVRVGIFFTGVKLDSGHSGVAFTPAGEIPEAVCCPKTAARMPEAGSLTEKPAGELLTYALSSNVLKSAIGVAAINALSGLLEDGSRDHPYDTYCDSDGVEFLDVRPDDTVCLVGAFTPYIRRFRERSAPFFIIEKTPEPLKSEEKQFFRPQGEARRILPDADVIIITGAAIVNHTLDGLVGLTRPDARVAVIGPTASMVPDVYFAAGVDIMAGIRVTDSDQMLRILEEGGSGYHMYKSCAEKVTFVKRREENSGTEESG